jgi:hypothetical protein
MSRRVTQEMHMTTQSTGRKAATKTSGPRTTAAKKSAAATAVSTRAKASKKLVRKVATNKQATAPSIPAASSQASKQSRLIAMLASAPGATIEQMMQLTGWQAHSVRGAISGVLRKRLGLNVACVAGDAGTVYRIVGNAVSA